VRACGSTPAALVSRRHGRLVQLLSRDCQPGARGVRPPSWRGSGTTSVLTEPPGAHQRPWRKELADGHDYRQKRLRALDKEVCEPRSVRSPEPRQRRPRRAALHARQPQRLRLRRRPRLPRPVPVHARRSTPPCTAAGSGPCASLPLGTAARPTSVSSSCSTRGRPA